MMSTIAPRSLRILCALPEPAATLLRRSFKRLRQYVDVTCTPASAIGSYLAEAGYYHALYVSPDDWRAFTPNEQRRCGTRVNLVVLAPDAAVSSDLADVRAGIYFPVAPAPDQVVRLCTDMHLCLGKGQTLNGCAGATDGQLAFVGDEACWLNSDFIARVESSPGVPSTSKPVAASGVNIEQVSVAGDVVQGDKSVIQADGDQAITATISGAAKIVQQAGGDQVNVNRVSGGPVDIRQTAGEDQANVNRVRNAAPQIAQTSGGSQANINRVTQTPVTKVCPVCGLEVSPLDRFCSNCGADI